jgi:hypothetical protein
MGSAHQALENPPGTHINQKQGDGQQTAATGRGAPSEKEETSMKQRLYTAIGHAQIWGNVAIAVIVLMLVSMPLASVVVDYWQPKLQELLKPTPGYKKASVR